jgi:hypothetical protein
VEREIQKIRARQRAIRLGSSSRAPSDLSHCEKILAQVHEREGDLQDRSIQEYVRRYGKKIKRFIQEQEDEEAKAVQQPEVEDEQAPAAANAEQQQEEDGFYN